MVSVLRTRLRRQSGDLKKLSVEHLNECGIRGSPFCDVVWREGFDGHGDGLEAVGYERSSFDWEITLLQDIDRKARSQVSEVLSAHLLSLDGCVAKEKRAVADRNKEAPGGDLGGVQERQKIRQVLRVNELTDVARYLIPLLLVSLTGADRFVGGVALKRETVAREGFEPEVSDMLVRNSNKSTERVSQPQ